MKTFSATSDTPPTRDEMHSYRDGAVVRALEYCRRTASKIADDEFAYHSGDIIFLYRFIQDTATDEKVRAAAVHTLAELIARFNSLTQCLVSAMTESSELMGLAECLHAKFALKEERLDHLQHDRDRLRAALFAHSVEDVLRFDPSDVAVVPKTNYCRHCSAFCNERTLQCTVCGQSVCRITDYENLREALVWTSVFADIGIAPVSTADGSGTVEDVIRIIKRARDYYNATRIGQSAFIMQMYFITHFIFIMSAWGAVRLDANTFAEELIVLYNTLADVIRIADAELVGEMMAALRILGVDDDCDPLMTSGYAFLLGHEHGGRMLGNWVKSSADFYTRYHAAYCGIIGLQRTTHGPMQQRLTRLQLILRDDDTH